MTKQHSCPVCKKRLFDTEQYFVGTIWIKCPHCKVIVGLTIKKNRENCYERISEQVNRKIRTA